MVVAHLVVGDDFAAKVDGRIQPECMVHGLRGEGEGRGCVRGCLIDRVH